jgi:TPR repeat protein
MSHESQLQLRPADSRHSLSLLNARYALVTRGLRDAAILTARVRAESEEEPLGVISEYLLLDDKQPEEVRKRAEEGDPKQQHLLALFYSLCFFQSSRWKESRLQDFTEAAKWFRRAADQGYAPAQFNLGWMYHNPYLTVPGVATDQAEAAKWFRRAADQGYTPAQFNLGWMYDSGVGVAQDHFEAVEWYRRAADKGFDRAQFNLGLKYDKGEGVGQDYAEAAKWFRRAADQGLGKAQFNLGLLYEYGLGLPQDYVQAYFWMTLAVAFSNDDDEKRYAAVREGVTAEMEPAQISEAQRLTANWYRKASEEGSGVPAGMSAAGSTVAQLNLGLMYALGQGVAQDYAEAAKWFRRAADKGFDKAQFNLGLLYEYGLGLPQDYVQAYFWMTLGASCYDQAHAASRLAARSRVASNMNQAQVAEAERLARQWKRQERK